MNKDYKFSTYVSVKLHLRGVYFSLLNIGK